MPMLSARRLGMGLSIEPNPCASQSAKNRVRAAESCRYGDGLPFVDVKPLQQLRSIDIRVLGLMCSTESGG